MKFKTPLIRRQNGTRWGGEGGAGTSQGDLKSEILTQYYTQWHDKISFLAASMGFDR